tara:strand:- start:6594 stop:6995 length:402 start_codon:yes stop_codon:yes gene_type:complete
MATLNLTSTISATGLTSDAISSSVLKSATVSTGGIERVLIPATQIVSARGVLLAYADYAAASATSSTYVYIKNAGLITCQLSVIGTTASTANLDEITLVAGAWTIFPWRADTADITLYLASGTANLVEYGVFN